MPLNCFSMRSRDRVRHLRRVFGGAQHRVVLIEQVQVEVVGVGHLGERASRRTATRCRRPSAPAESSCADTARNATDRVRCHDELGRVELPGPRAALSAACSSSPATADFSSFNPNSASHSSRRKPSMAGLRDAPRRDGVPHLRRPLARPLRDARGQVLRRPGQLHAARSRPRTPGSSRIESRGRCRSTTS